MEMFKIEFCRFLKIFRQKFISFILMFNRNFLFAIQVTKFNELHAKGVRVNLTRKEKIFASSNRCWNKLNLYFFENNHKK